MTCCHYNMWSLWFCCRCVCHMNNLSSFEHRVKLREQCVRYKGTVDPTGQVTWKNWEGESISIIYEIIKYPNLSELFNLWEKYWRVSGETTVGAVTGYNMIYFFTFFHHNLQTSENPRFLDHLYFSYFPSQTCGGNKDVTCSPVCIFRCVCVISQVFTAWTPHVMFKSSVSTHAEILDLNIHPLQNPGIQRQRLIIWGNKWLMNYQKPLVYQKEGFNWQ